MIRDISRLGWMVREANPRSTIPRFISERYPWLPDCIVEYATQFDEIVSPSENDERSSGGANAMFIHMESVGTMVN